MSIDHTYEVGNDDSSTVSINISGLDKGGNPIDTLGASIYAYDTKTGTSRFTCELSIDDLRRLHQHLSKYSIVTDVHLNEIGKFVEVANGTEELIAVLSAATANELLPALRNLIDNRLSKDDINMILGRKDSLTTFEQMLSDADAYSEADWQRFFEDNEWIFGYGLKHFFLQIIQREAHISRTGLGGANDVITDFLLSDSRFTKLVELKTPRTKLFENRKNRSDSWRLSTDLTDAVSQILAQKANWELEADHTNFDADGNVITEGASDVECILVIGSHDMITGTDKEVEIKLKTLELFRRNLRNIEIILFDELFDRSKFIVEGVVPRASQ